MLILAIDSSSLVASVALADESTIIAEYTINMKKTHSRTLLPMIDEIIKMTSADKKDIDAIAVTKGPGSFTGLRIGASTAKGLALALEIPIIGISTIETMAYNYNHCNKLLCPIMDARRNQVYTGIYRCELEYQEEIMAPVALSIEELISDIKEIGKETIFIGDGIPVFKDYIDEHLSLNHYFAKNHLGRQRASSLAALAVGRYREGRYENGDLFAPEYMRLSQAERERLENDKRDGRQ